jgi:hypothetical protein
MGRPMLVGSRATKRLGTVATNLVVLGMSWSKLKGSGELPVGCIRYTKQDQTLLVMSLKTNQRDVVASAIDPPERDSEDEEDSAPEIGRHCKED